MANIATDKPLLKKNLLAMVCLSSFLALNCSSSRLQAEEAEPKISQQLSNKTFKMRMLSYCRVEVSGIQKSHYVGEAARGNSDDWQFILKTAEEVSNFYQSTPGRSQSHLGMDLISESVGYIFSGKELVVTTDGGQSWKSVDLSSYFSEPAISKDAYIGEIVIYQNGRGTLTIFEEYSHRGISEIKTLYTFDSGQNWAEKQIL